MRVRAAHKAFNQAPVVLEAAHMEKKYIVPTPERLQSNLKLPMKRRCASTENHKYVKGFILSFFLI